MSDGEPGAAGTQHLRALADRLRPIRDVLNDAEAHDRVGSGDRLCDVADVADRQRHRTSVRAAWREIHHCVSKVDRADAMRTDSLAGSPG